MKKKFLKKEENFVLGVKVKVGFMERGGEREKQENNGGKRWFYARIEGVEFEFKKEGLFFNKGR